MRPTLRVQLCHSSYPATSPRRDGDSSDARRARQAPLIEGSQKLGPDRRFAIAISAGAIGLDPALIDVGVGEGLHFEERVGEGLRGKWVARPTEPSPIHDFERAAMIGTHQEKT